MAVTTLLVPPFALLVPLLLLLLLSSSSCRADDPQSRILDEGKELIYNFYSRYNTTQQIDLVFVLDRSGSVPRQGWVSTLNFVKDLLEHFTVDSDNTRVAIITFSTTVSVDVNDLQPGFYSDRENKCTLNRRIYTYIERKVPHGYTATFAALARAHDILLRSRPNAKKAVFVVTDGHSNIGPPPVKSAFDILSLKWDRNWDETTLGPQVEIFAFGIDQAYRPELQSIASNLPQHVLSIPNFHLFQQLARSLHGARSVSMDKQEESWTIASLNNCGTDCSKPFQTCMCGTLTGQYACVCTAGYEMHDGKCRACNIGHFKDAAEPIPCQKCPSNTTSDSKGATSRQECALLPGLRRCPPLPDVEHATKFFVTGVTKNEVLHTGIACNAVSDGNSCHYQCSEGYRLSGSPVMVCNSTAMWEGSLPSCKIIDCSLLKDTSMDVTNAVVNYLNITTTYGSMVNVTCNTGSVALGSATWRCDRHGRWTKPRNFMCAEIFCPPPVRGWFLTLNPSECNSGKQPLGRVCRYKCKSGFNLEGGAVRKCGYDNAPSWLPVTPVRCIDVQKPRITCPSDVEVEVPSWGMNNTVVHYDGQPPHVTDNSGYSSYKVIGLPSGSRFSVGSTSIRYEAVDKWGNKASCEQIINVKEKFVKILSCPASITLRANSPRRSRRVTWLEPYFFGPGNIMMSHTCSPANGVTLPTGTHAIVCYPNAHPGTKCQFSVTITDPPCDIPFIGRPPTYGALLCGNTSYPYPKTCRIHCKNGYALLYHEHDHQFKCDWDGKWDVRDRWPDCSPHVIVYSNVDGHLSWKGGGLETVLVEVRPQTFGSRRAQRALMVNKIHVRYEGRCEDKKDALRAAFIASLRRLLQQEHAPCRDHNRCRVTNVKVHCGHRSRRSVSPLFDFSPVEGDTDRPRSYRRHSVRRSVEQASDADGASTANMHIEFEIEGVIANNGSQHNITLIQQKTLLYKMDDLIELLMSAMEHNFTLEVDGEVANVTAVSIVTFPQLQLNCLPGEVSELKEMSAKCHSCAAGSYYLNNTCVLCDYGFFQPYEAKLKCRRCPPGTSTTILGANNRTYCRRPCRNGTVSATGYEPCTLCARDTFQPVEGNTTCLDCPYGTATFANGSNTSDDCIEFCQPGSRSDTGLAPCDECPLGRYQPEQRQTECLVCERNNTQNSLCPVLVNCTANVTCQHGDCVVYDAVVSCLCVTGFEGPSCDVNHDDCTTVMCLNGGSCIDGINEATCVCRPGYTGVTCQMEIGECASAPCRHGYCLNLPASYECICRDGYEGRQCETSLNTCQSEPCLHGNCSDVDDRYLCRCLSGYTGTTCETQVDHCAVVVCDNGAVCENTPSGPYCDCLPGYTGPLCADDINECAGRPCQNGAECVDTLDRFICKCKPGFGGETCGTVVSADFDLIFSRASTMDFVLMRNIPRLEAISVCLWMRTSDVSHYGTIMSYAADSNWLSADDSNVFVLHDYGSLELWVNGEVVQTQLILNDARWHHLCATWSQVGGEWAVFVNGSAVRSGSGLATMTHLEGGGYLVIGQEQDSVGGNFNSRESFIGEITQFNVYDHVLSDDVVKQLANGPRCDQRLDHAGNVVAWTEIRDRSLGALRITDRSFCLDINECQNPGICDDDERCTDLIGSFECERCEEGMRGCGPNPWDVCSHVTCENQATCVTADDMTEGGFACMCVPGTTGRYCEFRLEPCASNPCLNGGTCNPHVDTYECWCPRDDMGAHCEALADRCLSSPCANGGTCIDDGGERISCLCRAGYRGNLCLRPVDACVDAPCSHGGTCVVDGADGFRCECTGRWRGAVCEIIYAPSCERHACLNGGKCVLTAGENARGYVCACPAQRPGVVYGQNCELRTPCSQTPCRNNGTCIRVDADAANPRGYECLCAPGHNGANCEVKSDAVPPFGGSTTRRPAINSCANVQCENGGTCINRDQGFKCFCDTAYNGVYCETQRASETRLYKVVIKLMMAYQPSLRTDKNFKKAIREQVHHVYLKVTGDSTIQVTITGIKEGSVLVAFDLTHTVFLDTDPPDLTSMSRIMERQLINGNLGDYPATIDSFSFERQAVAPSTATASWMFGLVAAGVVVVLVLCTAVVICCLRRRNGAAARRARKPLNNHRETITLTRVNNDIFIEPEPPTPPPRPRTFVMPKEMDANGENMYADIDMPRPYAMTTAAELQNRQNDEMLDRRYPSKRGRDVNAENAGKTNTPPVHDGDDGGYLAPVRLPGYHEVSPSGYPVEDDYLAPLSDEEAAALERKQKAKGGNGNGAYVADDDEYLVPQTVGDRNRYPEGGGGSGGGFPLPPTPVDHTPPPPYRDRYSVTEYAIRGYPPTT